MKTYPAVNTSINKYVCFQYSEKEKALLTGEDAESLLNWMLLACHLPQDYNALVIKNFFFEKRDSSDFLVIYPSYRTLISIESKRTYANGAVVKAGKPIVKLV